MSTGEIIALIGIVVAFAAFMLALASVGGSSGNTWKEFR